MSHLLPRMLVACLFASACIPVNANTTFSKSQSLPADDPTSVTIAHWAGRDQLVTTNYETSTVVVYKDNGTNTGMFDSGTAYSLDINLNQGRGPVAVAIGVLDINQGLQGVAVANKTSNNVSVFHADSSTGQLDPANHHNYDTGHSPSAVAFASFSSPAYDDLLVANAADNTVTIFIGAPLGAYASTLTINVNPPRDGMGGGGNGSHPDCVAPSSLAVIRPDAAESRDRFIVTCETTGSAVIFTNLGGNITVSPLFVATASAASGNSPSHVTLGDFDHDGTTDFAITSYADNRLHVTSGASLVGTTYVTGSAPSSVAVGSFTTGSTGADLAVANFGDGTASIFINRANGQFDLATTIPIASFSAAAISIASAHVSRNDLSDLVIANRLDDVRVMFNTSLPDRIFANGFERNTGGL